MAHGGGPVGFIGLGMMGLPMARNLLRRGRALIVHDPSVAACAALAEGSAPGAVCVMETPVAVADVAEVVVLMLPNSAAVARVMEGPGGLLTGLRIGQLVIDMGSSPPEQTRRLAGLAAGWGAGFIDAPVSGSVAMAAAGTLTILVGGGDTAWAKAEPVLRGMGGTLIRIGAIGSAHAMKAAKP
jgi:3-hydroxyisobutyrate dehydrogenase